MPRWWRVIQIVGESTCMIVLLKVFVYNCVVGNVPEGVDTAIPVIFGLVLAALFGLLVGKNVYLLRHRL